MPITLGINIQSLASQKRLADASEASGRIFERLSSGLRINRASDDAAGLAISESLRTDARVYSQGIRNFNDGISLLTMADAAIEQLIGITIRIAELAEQSANGTYGVEQRKASDAEAQALSKEFFRISKSTEFNGIGLFDGELSQLTVQGGYGSEGKISSSIGGALGTGEFRAMNSYSNFGGLMITNADFNGDGALDLATVNYDAIPGFEPPVSILLGKGNGEFTPAPTDLPTSSPSYSNPVSALTGDFTGDGVLDLVVGHVGGALTSYIGKGDGSFSAAEWYSPNIEPSGSSFSTGDFNGDGKLDIVSAHEISDTVRIFLGQGNGGFSSANSYSVGSNPQSVKVADFNRDGVSDLVTADSSGSGVSVLLGRGDGTFNSRVSYAVGTGGQGAVETGDLNGDGALDLITLERVNNTFSVLLGRGDGTFGSSSSYASNLTAWNITLGDFNGDGALDLVTGDVSTGTIGVRLGRGNGTFNQEASVATGGGSVYAVSASDFDGDGVLDLVASDADNGSANILLGTTREGINPLLSFSLKTMADARQALSMIQKKREQLSSQRGVVGALQARLTVGVSTLTTKNENYLAAASRVRDIDVAQDAAEAVRLRILKETGAAILSQANQVPSLALALLR